jgi:uncharacterized protein
MPVSKKTNKDPKPKSSSRTAAGEAMKMTPAQAKSFDANKNKKKTEAANNKMKSFDNTVNKIYDYVSHPAGQVKGVKKLANTAYNLVANKKKK